MWNDRHLAPAAPRASVLSPKLSSQREAIARRFRQREALYASSRYDGSDEGETEDGAEEAGSHSPEAQKRYVYRSHLPLEPEDFIPTLAEPMQLASLPLPIEPDPEFSADATEDFDLDQAEPDDDSDVDAWAPPLGARPDAPLNAARGALQPAAAPRSVARRMPTVDYPQMRPLHQTFAPSRARAAAPGPRPAPESAAVQARAVDPRWAMLGAEAHSAAGMPSAQRGEHREHQLPAGTHRARHDAAPAVDASGSVRGPRRGTPPMGVVLRRSPAADPALPQSTAAATDPRSRAAQPAARAPQRRPDLEQAPPTRPRPERPQPAAPQMLGTTASVRGPQPVRPADRAPAPQRAAAGAPQATQPRPRHTHTVRFAAALPEGAPHGAPRGTTAPRPAAAAQTYAPQRAAQAAPALAYASPQPGSAQRQAASQPSRGEQARQPAPNRPAGRRPTPTQQFVAARPNTASHDAALHVPPQTTRAEPSRPLARQPSPQPQLMRSRINTVSYGDLPRHASQIAPGQAVARNLRDTMQPARVPQPAQALGHERISRIARKDARPVPSQTASLRAPISMQPEPLTLRGLQPALSLSHPQPGRSQTAQLHAQPQRGPATMQAYALPPQLVPAPAVEPVRSLRQPAPALAPAPQAWPTYDDEAAFEPRRSGRGRHWLLGSMAAAGLLGSVVIGRLLLSSPAPATLAVETLPFDASVTVDGRPLPGTRSPYRAQDLQAGEHLLIVQKPGFATHTERVTLREGEERRLATLVLTPDAPPTAISLEPVAAATALPSEAAAKPERARRRSRSVDADEPRERPERSVRSSSHDDSTHATEPRESDVTERASSKRHSDPEPTAASERSAPARESGEEGMLRINSRPWAEVYVDGKRVGTTPQMALRLRAGQHKVELVNPDLEMRKSLTVEIEPGELTTQIVTLQE